MIGHLEGERMEIKVPEEAPYLVPPEDDRPGYRLGDGHNHNRVYTLFWRTAGSLKSRSLRAANAREWCSRRSLQPAESYRFRPTHNSSCTIFSSWSPREMPV